MRRSGCGIGLQTSVSVTDVRVIALTRSVRHLYVSVCRKHSSGKCRRVWFWSFQYVRLIYRHTGHEHASTTARRRHSHFANRTYIIHIAQGRRNKTWTNLDKTFKYIAYIPGTATIVAIQKDQNVPCKCRVVQIERCCYMISAVKRIQTETR